MEWKESAKWFVLMVSAGVVTAVAIQFVTRYLEQRAILAAKVEVQKLVMAAAAQMQADAQNPAQELPSHLILDESGVGYTNVA